MSTQLQRTENYQKMDLLLALYITAIVSAELLGGKTFTFAGLNASVAIFVFPLTFTINDIVVEVYGKERARSFIRSGFKILILLGLFTTLAMYLPPTTRFAPSNEAYLHVFSKSQRIIVASLTAFWLSEQFDVFVFSKIRQRFGKHGLWLRNNASNFISQLVDTTLFMMLAFYSGNNFTFVVSLIIPYWLLKCAFSVFETPFTYLGVHWLKKGEK